MKIWFLPDNSCVRFRLLRFWLIIFTKEPTEPTFFTRTRTHEKKKQIRLHKSFQNSQQVKLSGFALKKIISSHTPSFNSIPAGKLPQTMKISNGQVYLHDISLASQSGFESGLNVSPSTLVFVLFLSPGDLGVWIFVAFLFNQIEWERSQLKIMVHGRLQQVFNRSKKKTSKLL